MSTDAPPPDDAAPSPDHPPTESASASEAAADDTGAGGAAAPADDAGAELPEKEAREVVAGRRHRDVMARLGQVGTRVDELADGVARVSGLHTELAVVVSEDLGPRLDGLWEVCREEIGQLRTAVAELLAEQEKQKNPPVDWIAMTEEQAAKQWPVLARWIGERLVPWYELTRADLPDCWALHRPVVVELSWLRSAHVQSYLDHTHPHITAEWHARWRPFVVARIKEAIDGKCRPGEHHPVHGPTMSGPPTEATPPNGVAQRAQLALPQHWWPFYQQAYYDDLAFRRERTARGQLNWTPPPPPPSSSGS